MTTTDAILRPTTAHQGYRPVAPKPGKWVLRAAHVAALSALPAGIWRVLMGAGVPVGFDTSDKDVPGSFTIACIVVTVVTEGLALLTLGLVQRWGEVLPRWIPVLGGKRVPPMAAVVPAGIGAAILTLVGAVSIRGFGAAPDAPTGLALAVMNAAYAPILLWGPLLAVVTVDYYRRHRA